MTEIALKVQNRPAPEVPAPTKLHEHEPSRESALLQTFTAITDKLDSIQEVVLNELKVVLRGYSGNVAPLESMQPIAGEIRSLLDRFGMRLKCPTCKNPAHLRAHTTGRNKTPVYEFDHGVIDGKRIFHARSEAFPGHIKLTARPADSRRSAGGLAGRPGRTANGIELQQESKNAT